MKQNDAYIAVFAGNEKKYQKKGSTISATRIGDQFGDYAHPFEHVFGFIYDRKWRSFSLTETECKILSDHKTSLLTFTGNEYLKFYMWQTFVSADGTNPTPSLLNEGISDLKKCSYAYVSTFNIDIVLKWKGEEMESVYVSAPGREMYQERNIAWILKIRMKKASEDNIHLGDLSSLTSTRDMISIYEMSISQGFLLKNFRQTTTSSICSFFPRKIGKIQEIY
jgi:hypothetical protein